MFFNLENELKIKKYRIGRSHSTPQNSKNWPKKEGDGMTHKIQLIKKLGIQIRRKMKYKPQDKFSGSYLTFFNPRHFKKFCQVST